MDWYWGTGLYMDHMKDIHINVWSGDKRLGNLLEVAKSIHINVKYKEKQIYDFHTQKEKGSKFNIKN